MIVQWLRHALGMMSFPPECDCTGDEVPRVRVLFVVAHGIGLSQSHGLVQLGQLEVWVEHLEHGRGDDNEENQKSLGGKKPLSFQVAIVVEEVHGIHEGTLQVTRLVFRQVEHHGEGQSSKATKSVFRLHVQRRRQFLRVGCRDEKPIQAPGEQIQYDLGVDATRNALAISKRIVAPDEPCDPTLQPSVYTKLAKGKANRLVYPYEKTKIAPVLKGLLQNEFDSFPQHSIPIDCSVYNGLYDVRHAYADSRGDAVAKATKSTQEILVSMSPIGVNHKS